EEIRIEADKAAENSAAIRARAPVRELVIHDWWMQQGPVARTAKALFASDLMPALTDLTLSRIDSPVLKELANCKRLTHLGGLTLSGSASDVSWLEPAPLLSRLSRLTLDGINRNSTESLLRSPLLTGLRTLELVSYALADNALLSLEHCPSRATVEHLGFFR